MIRLKKDPHLPAGGRSPSITQALTRQKMQYAADAVLRRGLSMEAWRMLDQLYVSGIMTVDQIGLAQRTLRNYAKKGLIARYTYPPAEVVRELGERFLPVKDGQLYTLGQVGMEILTMRHGLRPTRQFLAYPIERILSALILNEIVQRIEAEATKQDWTLKRYSFEQAQLSKNEKVILSPSTLISLEKGDRKIFFAIEYHDEENSRATWKKAQEYEDAYECDLWEEKWLGERFPLVLAVFRHNGIGEGYREAILAMRTLTSFYGRSLEGLLQADRIETWVNIEKGSREKVFPWQD